MIFEFFAKRFVAGKNIDRAVLVSKKLEFHGLRVTLDHLGEDVMDRGESFRATNEYIKLIEEIRKQGLNSSVAVKLSQIGLAIDKKLAIENLEKILIKAKIFRIVVEIDMEGSKYTNDSVNIYLKIFEKYKNVVQALQAYLYRTEKDLKKILKKGGKVRLVKGAYKESKENAFQDKKKVNENYVKLMKMCLKHCAFVYVATHDEGMIKIAKKFIKDNDVDERHFEFQMLYGVKRKLQKNLVKEGYKVRVYVPYGKYWIPYFYRRLKERKENLFFVFRNLFG